MLIAQALFEDVPIVSNEAVFEPTAWTGSGNDRWRRVDRCADAFAAWCWVSDGL